MINIFEQYAPRWRRVVRRFSLAVWEGRDYEETRLDYDVQAELFSRSYRHSGLQTQASELSCSNLSPGINMLQCTWHSFMRNLRKYQNEKDHNDRAQDQEKRAIVLHCQPNPLLRRRRLFLVCLGGRYQNACASFQRAQSQPLPSFWPS